MPLETRVPVRTETSTKCSLSGAGKGTALSPPYGLPSTVWGQELGYWGQTDPSLAPSQQLWDSGPVP